MNHLEACVVLNMIPSMGPVRLRRLMDAFGTAEKILLARTDQLTAVDGIGRETADNISRWEEFADPAVEMEKARGLSARIITAEDEEYPAALREIHDPPIVLYVRGQITGRDRNAVAVVGSRRASHYATECAKKLSFQMAYSGLTIVSGLARGIDSAAHQGALAAKGRTLAVIGSGLGHIYPPENADLADRIAANGAVISEFPIDTKPDRQTFPIRNRVVTGCSFGVLVVEAGANSGALISANQAAEQGRTLYAVPGRIDHPNCLGSNRLIQQGAKLVVSVEDILDDLPLVFSRQPELPAAAPAADLTADQEKILEALGPDETGLDTIIATSGLPASVVSSTLLALEIRRLVKQLPGKRFVKLI
ncbi:MAG: DNA-protecting protein DprA [Chthoniobacterales bacterium]|nr:DNA-protecting protein DprA [Chthoniobacterales bacterium]